MDRIWAAAAVHLFTALGSVCALFATRAVIAGAWEQVFFWLGIALFIDGVDGALARLAKVSSLLPRFSGDRLDWVIDYVTYVFVPALALLQAGYLGAGGWGLLPASLILLSSLFHFSDTESKGDDYSFVGFPAVWNVVALYIFAFALPVWLAVVLVLACVALTFVPMHWAHPMRTPFLRPITIALTVLWLWAAAATLWAGFPARGLAAAVLALTVAYGIGLTFLRTRWR